MPDEHHHCDYALEETAKLLSGKWTLLILYYLSEGTLRFGELERLLGVNPRTLSNRLSQLEEAGVVRRTVYAEVPPRVEYGLTEKGRGLLPIIQAMRVYANRWMQVDKVTT